MSYLSDFDFCFLFILFLLEWILLSLLLKCIPGHKFAITFDSLLHFTLPKLRCINGKSIKVPSVYSYVVVLPPEQPSITLNGTANIGHDYESFIQGIDLFSTVTISMNHEIEKDEGTTTGTNGNSNNNNNNNNGNGNKDSSKSNDEDSDPNSSSQEDTDESNGQRTSSSSSPNTEHKLDACTVQVYPPLNSDHEFFKLPVNFMDHLGVHYKQTKDGVVIHGKLFGKITS